MTCDTHHIQPLFINHIKYISDLQHKFEDVIEALCVFKNYQLFVLKTGGKKVQSNKTENKHTQKHTHTNTHTQDPEKHTLRNQQRSTTQINTHLYKNMLIFM